jgi:acetylornithine deacetylase/succinyl-diaminopimelate desuccinylase-like protein
MSLPDPTATASYVDRYYEDDALAVLSEYITIPCLSPDFDAEWAAHGAIDSAARLFVDWAGKRPLARAAVELVELPGRTPCVLVEIAPTDGAGSSAPALFYGHLDKQPPLGTWSEGLDAFTPVRRGDRLFGRGSADDGYAIFAAMGAVEATEALGAQHGPVTVLIEASEESASTDLDFYLDALASRIGQPALVVCLDSGGASYDRLWTTSSLRGLVDGFLRVEVLTDAIHSGIGSGVVPSSFRVLRQLLDRIDDPATGDVRLEDAWVEIPPDRRAELDAVTESETWDLPVVPGLRLEADDARGLAERGTWRAGLEILGAEGLPPLSEAGNLLRPSTTVKVSLRIPPTADPAAIAAALSRALTEDPPSGARVTFTPGHAAAGWNAPTLSPWLAEALAEASTAYFRKPAAAAGVGGSIPFMASLGHRYPGAQFLATGALGPGSNAHGIDESLHLPAAKAITASAAHLLAALAQHAR